MKTLYRFFNSIRLTIVLTYVIVILTIAGSFTLLFQKKAFETIDSEVLISWLQKAPTSASWWIIALVVLIFFFSINTVICTIDRLAALLKIGKGKKRSSEVAVEEESEEDSLATEDMKSGRRVRFRTLLPYIAHIGFLIALAGHLSGSLFGFRGADIMAGPGEQVQIREDSSLSLEIGKLDMVMSKRGYPESMWGEVTLLVDGKEAGKKRVEINHPLLYGNLAVYIKSVQNVPKALALRISGPGGTKRSLLEPGKTVQLERDKISITGGRINSRYGAMEIILLDKGVVAAKRWISPYDRAYRTFSYGGYRITAEELISGKAGVFSVNRDPGVWIVFTGLTIFAGALLPHLFLRRQGKSA